MKPFGRGIQFLQYIWCMRTAILIPVLLILLFATGQASSKESKETITMTYPNYQASSSDSPVMTDSETGIKTLFPNRTTQAVFQSSGPWPLFGIYRAGQTTMAEFGSQIDSHLLLVVTHKESKGIYTGRILKDDMPPKNIVDAGDRGGHVLSTSSYFNVDIKMQCRIPGTPGKYWVVVLLGKLASPVLEFEVK